MDLSFSLIFKEYFKEYSKIIDFVGKNATNEFKCIDELYTLIYIINSAFIKYTTNLKQINDSINNIFIELDKLTNDNSLDNLTKNNQLINQMEEDNYLFTNIMTLIELISNSIYMIKIDECNLSCIDSEFSSIFKEFKNNEANIFKLFNCDSNSDINDINKNFIQKLFVDITNNVFLSILKFVNYSNKTTINLFKIGYDLLDKDLSDIYFSCSKFIGCTSFTKNNNSASKSFYSNTFIYNNNNNINDNEDKLFLVNSVGYNNYIKNNKEYILNKISTENKEEDNYKTKTFTSMNSTKYSNNNVKAKNNSKRISLKSNLSYKIEDFPSTKFNEFKSMLEDESSLSKLERMNYTVLIIENLITSSNFLINFINISTNSNSNYNCFKNVYNENINKFFYNILIEKIISLFNKFIDNLSCILTSNSKLFEDINKEYKYINFDLILKFNSNNWQLHISNNYKNMFNKITDYLTKLIDSLKQSIDLSKYISSIQQINNKLLANKSLILDVKNELDSFVADLNENNNSSSKSFINEASTLDNLTIYDNTINNLYNNILEIDTNIKSSLNLLYTECYKINILKYLGEEIKVTCNYKNKILHSSNYINDINLENILKNIIEGYVDKYIDNIDKDNLFFQYISNKDNIIKGLLSNFNNIEDVDKNNKNNNNNMDKSNINNKCHKSISTNNKSNNNNNNKLDKKSYYKEKKNLLLNKLNKDIIRSSNNLEFETTKTNEKDANEDKTINIKNFNIPEIKEVKNNYNYKKQLISSSSNNIKNNPLSSRNINNDSNSNYNYLTKILSSKNTNIEELKNSHNILKGKYTKKESNKSLKDIRLNNLNKSLNNNNNNIEKNKQTEKSLNKSNSYTKIFDKDNTKHNTLNSMNNVNKSFKNILNKSCGTILEDNSSEKHKSIEDKNNINTKEIIKRESINKNKDSIKIKPINLDLVNNNNSNILQDKLINNSSVTATQLTSKSFLFNNKNNKESNSFIYNKATSKSNEKDLNCKNKENNLKLNINKNYEMNKKSGSLFIKSVTDEIGVNAIMKSPLAKYLDVDYYNNKKEEKSKMSKILYDRLINKERSGEILSKGALKSKKNSSNKAGVFVNENEEKRIEIKNKYFKDLQEVCYKNLINSENINNSKRSLGYLSNRELIKSMFNSDIILNERKNNFQLSNKQESYSANFKINNYNFNSNKDLESKLHKVKAKYSSLSTIPISFINLNANETVLDHFSCSYVKNTNYNNISNNNLINIKNYNNNKNIECNNILQGSLYFTNMKIIFYPQLSFFKSSSSVKTYKHNKDENITINIEYKDILYINKFLNKNSNISYILKFKLKNEIEFKNKINNETFKDNCFSFNAILNIDYAFSLSILLRNIHCIYNFNDNLMKKLTTNLSCNKDNLIGYINNVFLNIFNSDIYSNFTTNNNDDYNSKTEYNDLSLSNNSLLNYNLDNTNKKYIKISTSTINNYSNIVQNIKSTETKEYKILLKALSNKPDVKNIQSKNTDNKNCIKELSKSNLNKNQENLEDTYLNNILDGFIIIEKFNAERMALFENEKLYLSDKNFKVTLEKNTTINFSFLPISYLYLSLYNNDYYNEELSLKKSFVESIKEIFKFKNFKIYNPCFEYNYFETNNFEKTIKTTTNTNNIVNSDDDSLNISNDSSFDCNKKKSNTEKVSNKTDVPIKKYNSFNNKSIINKKIPNYFLNISSIFAFYSEYSLINNKANLSMNNLKYNSDNEEKFNNICNNVESNNNSNSFINAINNCINDFKTSEKQLIYPFTSDIETKPNHYDTFEGYLTVNFVSFSLLVVEFKRKGVGNCYNYGSSYLQTTQIRFNSQPFIDKTSKNIYFKTDITVGYKADLDNTLVFKSAINKKNIKKEEYFWKNLYLPNLIKVLEVKEVAYLNRLIDYNLYAGILLETNLLAKSNNMFKNIIIKDKIKTKLAREKSIILLNNIQDDYSNNYYKFSSLEINNVCNLKINQHKVEEEYFLNRLSSIKSDYTTTKFDNLNNNNNVKKNSKDKSFGKRVNNYNNEYYKNNNQYKIHKHPVAKSSNQTMSYNNYSSKNLQNSVSNSTNNVRLISNCDENDDYFEYNNYYKKDTNNFTKNNDIKINIMSEEEALNEINLIEKNKLNDKFCIVNDNDIVIRQDSSKNKISHNRYDSKGSLSPFTITFSKQIDSNSNFVPNSNNSFNTEKKEASPVFHKSSFIDNNKNVKVEEQYNLDSFKNDNEVIAYY